MGELISTYEINTNYNIVNMNIEKYIYILYEHTNKRN